MKHFAVLFKLIIVSHFCISAQVFIGETEVDTSTIITGLDIPWEIQWGPDNYIWTTERFGRVSRINPESGEQDIILDISDHVYQSGESGLLGLVLHPDFDEQPYVYMAYTYRPAGQILEKIVRYEYSNGLLNNEFILLDNIQGNSTHIGCRLIILPDLTLLFTTGDAQNQPAAQDVEHLSGKTLRINLDGSVPSDNPFPGNPVYSFGHRNAQGLFLASNGIVYSSEHGPSTDDELNIIEPGRNYGWPHVHGYCNLPDEITFCEDNNVFEPITAWTPTIATSDIIYYDHPSIPEWHDKVLLTSLKNKRLYVLELDEDGTSVIGEEQYFANWWGRLRDICMSPDGAVYIATNGPDWGNSEPFTHKIIKIWNPDAVSVDETNNSKAGLIRIYPNPAMTFFTIDIPAELIGQQIKIYSIDGKLVLQQLIDSVNHYISIASIGPGVFFVFIETKKEIIFSEKLFILEN